jgi:outer membrane protein OmpA-like peptidoglycan-associated protein
MMTLRLWWLFAALSVPCLAFGDPTETEILNVTAELADLRTNQGVTRLAVRYRNGGDGEAGTDRFEASKIVIVDTKSKQKHFPIQDANGQFIAGPIGDEIGGAVEGGIAAGGKTLGLEGALKDLQAKVTEAEIKIELSADVLFDFDEADLRPAAEAQLNHLLTVVSSRPSAVVTIEGHTDVRGDEAYNLALSQRRADSVRSWLTGHGVAEGRLNATGAGESRPVREGDGEADHQANRRGEIRITGS